MTAKYDKNKFVEKSIERHGSKYDYSETEYVNSSIKVKIICPKHGSFMMAPAEHIRGSGCPQCANENVGNRCRKTKEEFIREATAVHGEYYDYSKVDFKTNQDKILINCPIHGEFYQTLRVHLKGGRCPKCQGIMINNLNEFIEKANKVHNYRYTYEKSFYTRRRDPITITCPIHGDFITIAGTHLQGHGCPHCTQSSIENRIAFLLRENNIQFEIEKRFDWLGKKRLDFYLPVYNAAIECQRLQHFRPVKFCVNEKLTKEEIFAKTKKRDEEKLKECEENGVKLYYYSNLGIDYPYFVYENFEELLKAIQNDNK